MGLSKKLGLFLILSVSLMPAQGWAVGSGGFENASFSPMSLSQGNAVVAQGDEPAAISYNPAAITGLPGVQVQYNSGFASIFTWYDGESVGVPDTRSSGTLSHIPSFYLTVNPGEKMGLNNRLAFGVGVDSPFGLSNKYDSRHPIVRYSTSGTSWLKMFTIKPVVALRVTDKFSIGAGPVWNRIFGLGAISQYPNSSIIAGSTDGQYRFNNKGNSWSWQLGAKYKLNPKHHFGFHFRAPDVINTRGQIEVENPVLANTIRVGSRAKLNLPMQLTGGYALHPNEKSVVEFDVGWTKWSAAKRVIVHADPVTTSAIGAINAGHDALIASLGTANTDWVDTFSLHLGGSYDVSEKLTLRAGTHFYWTPVPKNSFRPNVPDSNSLGIGIGGSYKLFKHLTADATYYNRFWFKRDIDNNINGTLEGLGVSEDGAYRSYGQQFIIGFRYLWDAFGTADDADVKKTEKMKNNKEDGIEKAFWKGLN